MTKIKLLILLCIPLMGWSQTKLSLDECRQWTRGNFPKMEQADLLAKITALKKENLKTGYMPQVDLKGQATYQSEVIEINLPLPNFSFDPVSKDQYKVYLDVKQTIWDGGISKSQQALEDIAMEAQVQKLEIEVQQAMQMVDRYFFGVLMVDKNVEVLKTKQELLTSQISKLQDAIKFGAAREKEKLKLEMENLKLNQNLSELSSKRKTMLALLAVLTGQSIDDKVQLQTPENVGIQSTQMRPELEYFNFQLKQIDQGSNLLDATRNPKLFGFGQAGYGKPGFNMLKNEFSPYYIVGIGLNWSVLDWNKVKRNKEINEQQKGVVNTLQKDFLQKQSLQIAEVQERISNLKALIDSDNDLVAGYQKIAEDASMELQNGSITSTDYLLDLNAKTVAEINLEMHRLQLLEAQVNYNSIFGY